MLKNIFYLEALIQKPFNPPPFNEIGIVYNFAYLEWKFKQSFFFPFFFKNIFNGTFLFKRDVFDIKPLVDKIDSPFDKNYKVEYFYGLEMVLEIFLL